MPQDDFVATAAVTLLEPLPEREGAPGIAA